jgi:hypothetical protein
MSGKEELFVKIEINGSVETRMNRNSYQNHENFHPKSPYYEAIFSIFKGNPQ